MRVFIALFLLVFLSTLEFVQTEVIIINFFPLINIIYFVLIFKSNGKINTVLICENDCNYHGECIDVNKCLCNEGWTGVYCQYEIMQSEDEERASLCLNAKYINHSYDVANGCYDRCRDPDFSVYNISYGIYFDSDVIIPNIYPNQYCDIQSNFLWDAGG